MAKFPAGVAIVTTTGEGGQPRGMTCSSLCSVAVEPPTLLVCLRDGSVTLEAVLRASVFAVNLLHDRAKWVAELFASGDPGRFDRIRWTNSPLSGGPHLVEEAHTMADCRVAGTTQVGDHAVVFGEVYAVGDSVVAPANPLLYGLRSYWSLGQTAPLLDPAPATADEAAARGMPLRGGAL
jgi:flavin reductase (DIM6/NTAB) family NADH-FMN oxidoreductase RutF